MARPQINLKAGDVRTVRLAVRDQDGSARDISTDTLQFRAAVALAYSTAVLTKTVGDGLIVVDAELGLVDIVFSADDATSASFPPVTYWEVGITDDSGSHWTLDFKAAGETTPLTYGILVLERALVAA